MHNTFPIILFEIGQIWLDMITWHIKCIFILTKFDITSMYKLIKLRL